MPVKFNISPGSNVNVCCAPSTGGQSCVTSQVEQFNVTFVITAGVDNRDGRIARICGDLPGGVHQRAADVADVVCVQNNYNLAHRHDDALIDDLARQGITFVST